MEKEKESNEKFYVHSACCMWDYELVYKAGKYHLECGSCGKPIGDDIKVIGKEHNEGCSVCEAKHK